MPLLRSILTCVFALILAAATLPFETGCAKKATVPETPPPAPAVAEPQPQLTLPERVADLNIVDDRADVSPKGRILNMPEWTIVGQKDRVHPGLTDTERSLIRKEVGRYFGQGPPDVTVDVYVTRGTQLFEAGERYESITATFGLRVEVASHANVRDTFVAEGEASLDREALDITYEELDSTYAQAITRSVRNAFERIIAQHDKARRH